MSMVQVILNCKGFQAIQTHRVAHSLWTRGKRVMALALQSRGSEVFAVDIHPGARIGAFTWCFFWHAHWFIAAVAGMRLCPFYCSNWLAHWCVLLDLLLWLLLGSYVE